MSPAASRLMRQKETTVLSADRVRYALEVMEQGIAAMKDRLDDLPDGPEADAAHAEELLRMTGELVLLSGQADALAEAIQHGA